MIADIVTLGVSIGIVAALIAAVNWLWDWWHRKPEPRKPRPYIWPDDNRRNER